MKKKVIILAIVFFVVLIGAVGIYFLQALNAETVSFDENSEAKYHTTLLETPQDDSTPKDHSDLENVAYVFYKLANTNEFYSETTGTAKASVATQKISNKRTVIGDKAFVQTISGGLISVGKQKYF